MIDILSSEGPFAGDEGCFSDVTEGRGVFSGDAHHRASDNGPVAGDVWGWAATALAGAAAYAGVRRLLDRRRGGAGQALLTMPATAAPRDDVKPADAGRTERVPAPSQRHRPTSPGTSSPDAKAAREAAQLVDELITLHDLEPNDTLRRRIVRSLSKVDVRIDEETGVAFDAGRHDVMGTIPAEAGVAPGIVVEVVRAGFVRADGHVVRATQVVVAADSDGAW